MAVEVAGWDNVAYSSLTVFEVMTINGWSKAMYR